MVSPMLITAICALIFIRIAQWLYKWYQFTKVINKIPGPKAYPIIGNALQIMSLKKEEKFKWSQEIAKKYNGISRLWYGNIINIQLTTAETAGVLLSNRNMIAKSGFYDFFKSWIGLGLISSTGNTWHLHRRLITPTFHFSILEEFAVVISKKAEILKQCIESELKINPQEPIDMFVLMPRCTLDVICETAMGINLDVQINQDSEYCLAVHNIIFEGFTRIFKPWLYNDKVYYNTSRGKAFKRNVEITEKLVNKVIREKKLTRKTQQLNHSKDADSERPKHSAFLDHLLDVCDRENVVLTEEELRHEVNSFMFAGHDTTAAAISWALFCIGNDSDVQEKIHREHLFVFGDSKEPATFQQLSELHYLERVIKETLRLMPVVPTVARTVTEETEIAGYKIPKGVFISVEIHAIHRDPKHWPNPEKFDPDRFLPENSNGRHPFAYVPFSAGLRNCIGKKFSLLEQKIILTTILRKWNIKSQSKHEDIIFHNAIILTSLNGVKIYFTPK